MAFTYPFFLLGLLTLAIPVFIHLVELRKPKRIVFTNVSFIRNVKVVTARQRKVKHLLILLCRLLFLAFLVLAFCQPFIPAVEQGRASSNHVRMLLDTSASMEAPGENDQPIFEQAIREASDLANVYPAATQFLLNQSRTPFGVDALQKAAEQLNPTANGPSAATLLARQAIESSKTGSQVFMFSDFQKNDFSAKSLDAAVDSSQQVFLVPLATAPTQNVYIDSVWVEDAFLRADADLLLHIRLRNGGNVAADQCRIKVFVGNRQVAALQTTVAAAQAVDNRVQIRLPGGAQQLCRVEVEDVPVTFDNTYFFTLQTSPPITVVDITAAAQPATRSLYSNESLFAYTGTQPTRLDYAQLNKADIILLQGVPQLEAGLRDNLQQLVKRGGTLILVPPVTAGGRASYTQLFQELGLGGLQWEPATTSAPVLREMAMPDLHNPFFRGVFTGPVRQAAMPKAAPVLRWSRSAADILRLRDGDGYLAQFTSGQGRVYVFAAPFEASYSDFTSQALFVPVMYRLAMQGYRQAAQPAYRLGDSPLTLAVGRQEAGGAEQVFKLTKDSATFIPAQRVVDGVLQLEVPEAMRVSGFYSLTQKDRKVTTLAFNVDKRESELARYSAAELRQMIGPDRANVHVYDASNGESVGARYRTERVGTPLWRYCLWAALFFLLAEIVIVRLSGRKAVAGRVPGRSVAA